MGELEKIVAGSGQAGNESIYLRIQEPSITKMLMHYAAMPFRLNILAASYMIVTVTTASAAAFGITPFEDNSSFEFITRAAEASGSVISAICAASVYRHSLQSYVRIRKILKTHGRIDKKAFDPLMGQYCSRQGGKLAADFYTVTQAFWDAFADAKAEGKPMAFPNVRHF